MALLEQASTLGPLREKIEAGERLDLEDGLAILESDDLLSLGELADLARRVRGGTDEVYFVQNLYLNQTNVCRVKCKFCAFAATRKQEHAYTITTGGARPRRGRAVRRYRLHRDPHGQRREPAHRVRLLRRHDPLTRAGAPRRAPQVLHGLRDPPHDDAVRPHARRGAARAQGRRARLPPGWRRGDLRRPRPGADRAGQGTSGDLVPRARHGPPHGDPDPLHDALRARRDVRGAGRPHPPAPRAAGPDGGLPRLHPAGLPSREHRVRAARLASHDRRRRPEDARRSRA